MTLILKVSSGTSKVGTSTSYYCTSTTSTLIKPVRATYVGVVGRTMNIEFFRTRGWEWYLIHTFVRTCASSSYFPSPHCDDFVTYVRTYKKESFSRYRYGMLLVSFYVPVSGVSTYVCAKHDTVCLYLSNTQRYAHTPQGASRHSSVVLQSLDRILT